MKKKIMYSSVMVAAIIAAFFIGRETAISDEYLVDPAAVVDWNTNGEELSLLTEDDYEYYCYKAK